MRGRNGSFVGPETATRGIQALGMYSSSYSVPLDPSGITVAKLYTLDIVAEECRRCFRATLA